MSIADLISKITALCNYHDNLCMLMSDVGVATTMVTGSVLSKVLLV